MIRVEIPGPPKPQGRGRIVTIRGHGAIKDPRDSAEWKGTAGWYMRQACPTPLEGPLKMSIRAIFPCPASDHRKTKPRNRRWHTKRNGDADNLAKAVLDAGNGVLYLDDCQVCALFVEKWIAAQGEAPKVEVFVHRLEE